MPKMDVGKRFVGSGGVCVIVISLLPIACHCPPKVRSEVTSPSGEYVASSYSFECGPIPPFNEHVGLKDSTASKFDEIAAVVEIPYVATLHWTGGKELQVVIDCRFEEASNCLPRPGRHPSIKMRNRWKDVRVKYEVGPRLIAVGAGDILKRIGSEL